MSLTRRELVCIGSSLGALTALNAGEGLAQQTGGAAATNASATNYARTMVGQLNNAATRQNLRTQCRGLRRQKFKIQIRNEFKWPVVVGLFGMHGVNLGQGMQYRIRIDVNNTHTSPQDIDGGDRMFIIWDEFTERIVNYVPVLLARNMRLLITQDGRIDIA